MHELNLIRIAQFVGRNLEFINCHMVDFLTKDLWEKFIPKEISDEILLDVDNCLDSLKKNVRDSNFIHLNKYLKRIQEVRNFSNQLELEIFENLVSVDRNNQFAFKHFMSDKKIHEVNIMAEILDLLAKKLKISHLIDIGDGKGYLSSLLALQYNHQVLGVDASNVNTNGSTNRLKKVQKYWNGLVKNQNAANQINSKNCNYKPITCYVTSETDLIDLLQRNFSTEITSIGLIGLHTCGNLAPSSIKIYKNNPNIKFLCNVGCCYHLLDEDASNFPMSSILKKENFKLGRNARMLASQCLERSLNPSQSLFYRALFQVYLRKYNLNDCEVGRKCSKSPNFIDYVKCAMKKCYPEHIVKEEELYQLFNGYALWDKKLQIFYLIRMHYAGLIEILILMDRLCYLREMGFFYSYLVKFFDPAISPRHLALVSFKSS